MHTHVTYGEMESHDVWSPKLSQDNPPLYDSRSFRKPAMAGVSAHNGGGATR